jgi:ferric-dicitrate binding protein FerR (iron transport regulator)
MNTPEHIGTLLGRYICGRLTPAEELELLAWRRRSEENEQLFREETDPENIRRYLREMYDAREPILDKIRARYPFSDPAPAPASGVHRLQLPRLLRIAACLILVAGIALFFLRNGSRQQPASPAGQPGRTADAPQGLLITPDGVATAISDMVRGWRDGRAAAHLKEWQYEHGVFKAPRNPQARSGQYNTIYAPQQAGLCVELPYGTRIRLSEGGSLQYPANYEGDSASIFIRGQADIEITENKKAGVPFRVSVQDILLDADQGHFRVRALPQDTAITVTLLSGSPLLIRPAAASAAVPLQAGQQAQVSREEVHILQPQAAHATEGTEQKK